MMACSRGVQPEGLRWDSPAPALSEVEGASGGQEARRVALGRGDPMGQP